MGEEFKGLRRGGRTGPGGGSSGFPSRPEAWPWETLWLFLVQPVWEDGTTRVPGTLLIFSEQGRLKACLGDRDSESVGFVTLQGGLDPLDELEGALRDDRIDWRASSSRNRRKG